MTENGDNAAATPSAEKPAAERGEQLSELVSRGVDASDEVLKSVEAGQRAAIEAVRKFLGTVDETIPAAEERPSRRETIVDAALDMADRLVEVQYGFIRSVVASAGRALGKPDEEK
jgi:hypothetical protein